MMRAKSGFFKGLNPVMALTALVVVFLFLIFGATWPGLAENWFSRAGEAVLTGLKWYYILVVACFLFFSIWLFFSKFGDIRLGDDDQKPEFGYFSWFSMLFGAGMGIGLVFWSIAEPLYHFQENPFTEEGGTTESARVAMRLTYFHWGLQPWAIYVVVGLSLSFFCYRKKLPLAIRSVLYPLIGERIYGFWGHAADVLAVFGTVFGVATSLGFGVTQMNTGLNFLFGFEISIGNQILLIAIISVIATLSVVSGVGRGVRILSELNLYLSLAILSIFLVFGPTGFILENFVEGVGDYLHHLIPLSFWTDAPSAAIPGPGWQGSWTAFYWGWWIAWAPFVGMFIARISRGRTIREFVLGVLLVPTLLAMIWLTIFGSTALHIELFGPGGILAAMTEHGDSTYALYQTIELMDLGFLTILTTTIATILIATYFITSSDSGTLVITTLLSVGDEEPPMLHRVIWGLGEGFVAAVLLLAGGLTALQSASILAALPFSFIMVLMCWGLVRGLCEENRLMRISEEQSKRTLNLGP